MKKVIAVLLAMLMLCSAMTVAFSVFAEDATVTEEAPSAGEDTQEEESNWFTKLVNRLIEVLTKLLAKLGIKIAIKGSFSDLLSNLFTTTEPTEAPTTAPAAAA